MSIQATLNEQSLAYLPRVVSIINHSESFEANQMKCKALEWMNTSLKPVAEMCEQEIGSFESALISVFKDKGWAA